VLDSVGGVQDRAIDALLVMGDPEYKGEPPAPVQSEQPPLVRYIWLQIPTLHFSLLRYSRKQN
jgi:hypothetical protein